MKLVYLHTNPISSNKANITQILYMCHAFAAEGLEVELIVPNSKAYSSMREQDILVDKKISKERNFRISEYPRTNFFSRFRAIDNFVGLRKKILQIEADFYFTRTPIILPLLRKRLTRTAV